MSDDIFAPLSEPTSTSLRKAVRYKKSDIKATLTPKQWLKISKDIPINVLDISSKGICIATEYKLAMNTKVVLNLELTADYACLIPAKVVRLYSTTKYGLVFDKTQHTAIDHLISDAENFTIAL
ncbi:MAG: PilZ domain-containing protein [Methyloprofundus sp.]|nr:PilZ domain-containing protein [Methyloprofundus sp.]